MVGGRSVSDRLPVPSLHLTAERDLIAPPQTAASGEVAAIASGHVGMIVGTARENVHERLRSFLQPAMS
jgi:polyhydroxyalkanoate synthase